MSFIDRGTMKFPEYSGIRCYMMPFIQGRPETLPSEFASYGDVVENFTLPSQAGEIGLITIDESIVQAGKSQRGYGNGSRNIHTEACMSRGQLSWGPSWGAYSSVTLDKDVRAIIANSVSDTCMVWDCDVFDTTHDGDLSMIAHKFPRNEGRMLKSGDVVEIGIFTPHEPIKQNHTGPRQFFRIVGTGVHGRESYFTENPLVHLH